jgi:hypothetical protein
MVYRVIELTQLLELAAINGSNRLCGFAAGTQVAPWQSGHLPTYGHRRDATAHSEEK